MGRIEQEIKNQNREILIQRIKESKYSIAFVLLIVIILLYNVYRSTDKIIKSEKLSGVLVGLHQEQTNLGSTTAKLFIKLKNGELIMTATPVDFVVKNNSEVIITKSLTEQGRVYYYFNSYKKQNKQH